MPTKTYFSGHIFIRIISLKTNGRNAIFFSISVTGSYYCAFLTMTVPGKKTAAEDALLLFMAIFKDKNRNVDT